MKNRIAAGALVAIVLGTGLFAVSPVSAQGFFGDNSTIVQRIADAFKLNKEKVQAVFDQVRGEHQAQMQTKLEEQLNQSVKDGKITEDQKKLILAKHKELAAQREKEKAGWQNLTVEQRRAQMEAHRQEMENWASQNGIDLQDLFPMGRGHKGFGMGR